MVDLIKALDFIDPTSLTYQEWLEIGMGLKSAANDGHLVSWQDWDDWSKRDPERYQVGVCEKKWFSFNSSGISKATVIYRAMLNGFKPLDDLSSLEWDSEIELDTPPIQKDNDFSIYIKTLFNSEDLVNIVTKSIEGKDGKFHPADSGFKRTAGDLIKDFKRYDNVENVIGDYNKDSGVWIRMNPVDFQGVKDRNITQFKYTLVESDKTDLETQLETIYNYKLPCAAIVYSGGKSVHAVVKIGAEDEEEYKRRVNYLHKILEKQNFPIDSNNKNASRLTRLPGVFRGEEKQYLIDVNTGYSDFATWQEYVENGFIEIELPEIKSFKDVLNNLPELAPELIEGVLRRGHKLLLSGSSKAGKSFCLIELAIALAEGREWLGLKCKKSKTLYINLEIDDASFYNRVDSVYKGLKIDPENADNIRIWNLRGKAQPMHKLTPKIIKRIEAENYDVIILDPVYKVQSGDENAAGDIAAFTNQFDKLTTELGVSLIYCHHHSKGNQGGKRAIDRASGSGVFARDPDAILDMIELDNDTYKHDDRFRDCSAWRVEGTLREFPPLAPINIFFDFPIHRVDHFGLLENAEYKNYAFSQLQPRHKTLDDMMEEIDQAFDILTENDRFVLETDMANYFEITTETLRKKLGTYNNASKELVYRRSRGKIYQEEK